MKVTLKPLLLAGMVAVGLTACGTTKAPAVTDLPNENQIVNVDDRVIYSSPDKFPNVVAWCDGSSRVYITSREYQDFVVVPNSPECPSR